MHGFTTSGSGSSTGAVDCLVKFVFFYLDFLSFLLHGILFWKGIISVYFSLTALTMQITNLFHLSLNTFVSDVSIWENCLCQILRRLYKTGQGLPHYLIHGFKSSLFQMCFQFLVKKKKKNRSSWIAPIILTGFFLCLAKNLVCALMWKHSFVLDDDKGCQSWPP